MTRRRPYEHGETWRVRPARKSVAVEDQNGHTVALVNSSPESLSAGASNCGARRRFIACAPLMAEFIREAAKVFREYEAHHRAKLPPPAIMGSEHLPGGAFEKAERNRRLAEAAEQILTVAGVEL